MSSIEKVIVLTQKQFKSIPGYTTKKSGAHFRGLIIGLLEELGASGYGFVEGNIVFQMNIEVADGSERKLSFRLRPSLITVSTQRRGKAIENVPKEAVTWKLMYEYLRNKIAILRIGVLDILEEMAGNVSMLTDQGEMTFGDFMRMAAEADRLNKVIQLEDLR